MYETRVGADDLGEMGKKSDDVVPGFPFNLIDPDDVKACIARFGPDRFRGFLGDYPEFGERVCGMCLDFEPDLEARLRLPDRSHFRAGIAGDHEGLRAGIAGGSRAIHVRPRLICFYSAL